MSLLEEEHPAPTKIQELAKEIWPLGFISYGGPMAHIGLFREKFVQKLKWIDIDRFNELTAICQSVPGPTSTQLIISIATFMTHSVWGGLVAFLLFFGPSFIVMFLAGSYLTNYDVPVIIKELLNGFKCSAVAVVLQAFWGLSKKYREDRDSIGIFTICAIVYFLMPNIIVMFGLFILSTLYCLYYKHIDVKISDQPPRNIFQAFVFGKPSVIAFFAVLVFTNFLIGSPSRLINSMAIFYRIGSVIIGGGHVILPMMWTEFSRFGYFDEPSYWNGFSLVSCLPGPMFNMAAYIGTLINGFIGAIFCCFGLYLPSFLTIWAVLPYWNFYRSNQKIQQIIYGLCCASIGFILAAVGMLWIAACLNTQSVLDTLINTAIAAAAYYFLEWRKIPIPYVIFGGGFKFILKSLLFGNTKI